jgi:hypothetical protein
MPETQYTRPLEAFNGMGYGKTLPVAEVDISDEKEYANESSPRSSWAFAGKAEDRSTKFVA